MEERTLGLTSSARLWTAALLVTFAVAPVRGADRVFEARFVDKQTGRPAAHATVTILGTGDERRTDSDGRLRWQPAPAPPFGVLVVLEGGRFARPVRVEELPASGALEIAVEPLLREAMTIHGAAPGVQGSPGSAAAVVTGADLALRGPANLVQSLETVAGVSSVSEGQAAAPVVRGLAAGRTVLLIDGARVTSERRVGPSAAALDPFVLESVEVSRGPASVAYGSDAFGGVIAARTRRIARGSAPAARAEAALGFGIPEWRGAVELSTGLRRGSLLAQGHARRLDDYRSPAGDVFNSGARDRGLLLRAEHEAGPGTLRVGWQSDFGREIERPRDNARSVRFYSPTDDSHRLTVAYDTEAWAGLERVSWTAFLGRHEVETEQDRLSAAPRRRERADVSAHDFQVRTLGSRGLGPAHVDLGVDARGRFGLEAIDGETVYDDGGIIVRDDATVSIERARNLDLGAFGSVRFPVGPRVLLTGGLRGDAVSTANRGGHFGDRETSATAASGFLAGSATIGRVHVTAQVSRGYREPTLSDRYFRGPSGRGFITGNPDLRAETSLQLDASLRYSARHWHVSAFAFRYLISDLVERYETDPDFFAFRNRGRARVEGLELEGQARLGTASVDLAAHVLRGELRGEQGHLDGVPPATVSLYIRVPILHRGSLGVRAAAYARDDRPGPTERVRPGYGVVDLSGSWRLGRRLELRLAGRNILDHAHRLSADTRSVLAPGRSILATVSARLGGGE